MFALYIDVVEEVGHYNESWDMYPSHVSEFLHNAIICVSLDKTKLRKKIDDMLSVSLDMRESDFTIKEIDVI